ncbi:MAG: esterase-like activity of phytase family protein, partial [Verrucomicrobiota bacterium]
MPTSPDGSKGGGRRALDAEGIVLLPGGGYWISDEYGPGLFRFDAQARLTETVLPPPALLPFQGA